jgi:hypothetical protein
MNDKIASNLENLVRELLTLVKDGSSAEADSGAVHAWPVGNPRGLFAAIDEWGSHHPGSALGMTRAAIAGALDPVTGVPFGPLLVDLVESAIAFGTIDDGNLDEFLHLRAPRIITAPNGTTHWAVLTAITDRDLLLREVIGHPSGRAHYRAEPPAIDVHLMDAHHAEELRAAYGLTLRDALNIDDRPAADRVNTVLGPLIASVSESDPSVGAALEWLVRNDPDGLMSMPFMAAAVDALQGNTMPREDMRLRFAHLLELEGLGYCAFLMWDTKAPLTGRERATLVGYIRRLADKAVAPWNRWSDLRTRREALAVWVRHLREDPLAARAVADLLRSAHPDDYATEPLEKTIRRIYRISTQMSGVQLPQGLVKAIREM